MLFTIFMNTIVGKFLPKFEGFILIVHVLGFVAILLPLAIMGSHQDAHEVFTTFLNEGNWPTQGLSFMIGLIGSVYVFTGKRVEDRWYVLLSDLFDRSRWSNPCTHVREPLIRSA